MIRLGILMIVLALAVLASADHQVTKRIHNPGAAWLYVTFELMLRVGFIVGALGVFLLLAGIAAAVTGLPAF